MRLVVTGGHVRMRVSQWGRSKDESLRGLCASKMSVFECGPKTGPSGGLQL